MLYRYTKLPRYLTTAIAAADCYLRLLEATGRTDGIPPWDFNVTTSNFQLDSSVR